MAEEIKKTEEQGKAEETTTKDAQKLGDDAMDQVNGGFGRVIQRPNNNPGVPRF